MNPGVKMSQLCHLWQYNFFLKVSLFSVHIFWSSGLLETWQTAKKASLFLLFFHCLSHIIEFDNFFLAWHLSTLKGILKGSPGFTLKAGTHCWFSLVFHFDFLQNVLGFIMYCDKIYKWLAFNEMKFGFSKQQHLV